MQIWSLKERFQTMLPVNLSFSKSSTWSALVNDHKLPIIFTFMIIL